MIAIESLDWEKTAGLIPAIIQHADTLQVLMLGYVSPEALAASRESGCVTFHSRSKGRLWMKGEQSGHVLHLVAIDTDCDRDSLLILARPQGPTCHLGRASCFPDAPQDSLAALDALIATRKRDLPEGSYSTALFQGPLRRIAQKVGEEGVETALAAVAEDEDALLGEAADLCYHLLVLLQARGLDLAALKARLAARQHGAKR